jgi:protein tyrosine/serine phosphatase
MVGRVSEAIRREFSFSRVFNFRDVGGYPTEGGRTVRWRRLFRSDTLSGLAEDDRAELRSLGVRTVLDLRRPSEVERQGQVLEWDGLVRHSIAPDHQAWIHTPYREGADPVRYLADRYRDMAEQGAAGLATVIGVIADEQAAPVVVHCVAGKDRTGVVCALTLSLLGVADADIDADYTRSTAGNQRYVTWAQANGQPDLLMLPWFHSPAGTMQLFLTELRQRHGSVERYLTGGGLDPAQVSALRAHMLT